MLALTLTITLTLTLIKFVGRTGLALENAEGEPEGRGRTWLVGVGVCQESNPHVVATIGR